MFGIGEMWLVKVSLQAVLQRVPDMQQATANPMSSSPQASLVVMINLAAVGRHTHQLPATACEQYSQRDATSRAATKNYKKRVKNTTL